MVLGKVFDDRWVLKDPMVPDDPLIHDYCQGRVCRIMSGKVPYDRWFRDDSLICDDCQGGACRTVSGKVPDDRWVFDN